MLTYEHVFIVENNKQIHVLQSNLYKYIYHVDNNVFNEMIRMHILF
jgi:hypothetical protein